MIGALLAFARAKPLDSLLIAGIVSVGAYLGWHLVVTDTALRLRASSAERERDRIQVDHARLVAAARFAEVQESERIRKQEQEDTKTRAALQARIHVLEQANAKLRLDLSDSANQLLDATTRYLAEQSRRASADPASAARINGESAALLGQLHGETDRAAGESAQAADTCAGKLTVLQDYVTGVCLKPN